ncbi:MAG: rRNA maturation RNase YbeY [Defluviitaleaceae bacterium]|nr:rRNA maturation RNase YbeY [Defluviitaleaceae bacterium]
MKIHWDERGVTLPMPYRVILRQVILEGLRHEARAKDCEISLSFVTVGEIQDLNDAYRDKDEPTDVLSFPAMGGVSASLGDIVICVEVAQGQAEEYGHSLEREMAFLTVHGLLHLLGYDHKTPEDDARMVQTQKEILEKVGLGR